MLTCPLVLLASLLPALPSAEEKTRGLLLGTFAGDALGGPVEFAGPERIASLKTPFRVWKPGEKLERSALAEYGRGLMLLPYAPLRSVPEPYAHWLVDAPPGTITDDSRHKLIVLDMLKDALDRGAWPVGEQDLARA